MLSRREAPNRLRNTVMSTHPMNRPSPTATRLAVGIAACATVLDDRTNLHFLCRASHGDE